MSYSRVTPLVSTGQAKNRSFSVEIAGELLTILPLKIVFESGEELTGPVTMIGLGFFYGSRGYFLEKSFMSHIKLTYYWHDPPAQQRLTPITFVGLWILKMEWRSYFRISIAREPASGQLVIRGPEEGEFPYSVYSVIELGDHLGDYFKLPGDLDLFPVVDELLREAEETLAGEGRY